VNPHGAITTDLDLDLDRDRIGSKATTPVADATGRIAPTVDPLNGHIKAKASKPEKPSGAAGQHVRSLLDLYVELFQAKRGKKPVIAKGRDPGILASLLAALELEETQHRLRAYFDLTDPFVVKNGYSLGIFQSRINALGATPTAVSSCACSYPQRYGHVAPCVKADPEDPYRNLRKRPEVERHCAACRRDFQTDDRDAERCPACEKAQ